MTLSGFIAHECAPLLPEFAARVHTGRGKLAINALAVTCTHGDASNRFAAFSSRAPRLSKRCSLWRAYATKESSTAPQNELVECATDRQAGVSGEGDGSLQAAGSDLGWLPAFPHVLTAAMANFLFGYHIGVMNGPLISIAHDLRFDGDTIMEGLVVSIFLVGAFMGSISGGVLADRFGRRRAFQLDMIPLILGAVISATAESVYAMILGRFLVGIGIGVNTGLVPVYISEVAPTKYRGALGSICQIGTCIGIIAALIIGIPYETDPHWWRTMFWIAAIPGVLLIIGMQFTVESPRWLGKVERWEDAENVIRKIWGESQVQGALEQLRKAGDSEDLQKEVSWSELFSERYYKAPAIGSALFALQQFAGINGVLYFSSLTFRDAGISDSMAASASVGVANFVGALSALYLMDRQGRRNLLMGSYLGMAISMAALVFALNGNLDETSSHLLSVSGTLMYVYTFALGAGPVTALIIPELSGTQTRAKTMAVSLCVHWVCNFVIGLYFLEFVKLFGLSAVYSSFGVVSLLSVAFTNNYIMETKGRSLEEIELLLNPQIMPKE